jgi:hypothetical protein
MGGYSESIGNFGASLSDIISACESELQAKTAEDSTSSTSKNIVDNTSKNIVDDTSKNIVDNTSKNVIEEGSSGMFVRSDYSSSLHGAFIAKSNGLQSLESTSVAQSSGGNIAQRINALFGIRG